jgi:hypothetical protein
MQHAMLFAFGHFSWQQQGMQPWLQEWQKFSGQATSWSVL